MKCSKCGMENAENVKFCTSCGEALLAGEGVETASNIPEAVSVDENKEEVVTEVEERTVPEQVSVEAQPAPVTEVPPAPPISPQATQAKAAPQPAPVAPQPAPVAPVPPVAPVQAQATQTTTAQPRPQAAAPQAQAAPQAAPQPRPQAAPQPQYQQAAPVQGVPMVEDKTVKPMTFGGWLWSLIVLLIPIVNFIFILVWSFSSGTNKSKKSFAQVLLLFTVINIILLIVFSILIAVGGSMVDGILDTAIDAAM